ncbi:hypothetical protein [Haloparvum sp. AD34]
MSEPAGSDVDDEQVRFRGTDRLGGDLVVTDRRILVGEGAGRVVDDVDREDADSVAGGDADGDVVSIPLETVSELTNQSIDWFLLLMDVAIIGFAILSLDRTLLGAGAFLAAGLVSLGLTWRRRGRVRIHTHSRPKPVDTYPEDREAFLETVDEVLAPIRAERPPAGDSVGSP